MTQLAPTSPQTDRASPGAPRLRIESAGLAIDDACHEAATSLAAHEHAEGYVCIVLGGAYEQRGGESLDCTRGSVVLHPPGHRHANRFSERGARCVSLHATGTSDDDSLARLLGRYRHVRLDPRCDALAHFERALSAEDSATPLAVATAALDLLATIARSRSQGAPSWLARVVDAIESDLSVTPSLDALAQIANVHPAHLARAFRHARGETVGDFLRRRRLEKADRELVATSRPLGDIALAAGFFDQAHFTRAYRRRYDATPMQRRKAMRA